MRSIILKVFIVCAVLLASAGAASASVQSNAGPDLNLASWETGTLQGSGSDSESRPLTYSWICNGGNVSSYNVAQPVFEAPYTSGMQAIYTCTLTVSNNNGASSSDSALIYVNYGSSNSYNYNIAVETNEATNVSGGQAVLNGNVFRLSGTVGTVYTWFQWGTSTSYGTESVHRAIGNVGPFDQHIADLLPNTTYHFRAAAQKNNGEIIYGQDRVFVMPTYTLIGYVPSITGLVAGASIVSTGLTNNPVADSFLLPLLIIVMGVWSWLSGSAARFADRLKAMAKK